MNGVWLNGVHTSQVFNRRGLSTAAAQTTNYVLLEGVWEREGAPSVHTFHVHPHPSSGCGAESSFVCVCDWCEGCADTQLLQIILKVNISLAASCLRWSLLSSFEEDFNLPQCTRYKAGL